MKQINQEIERLSNKFNLIEAIEIVKKKRSKESIREWSTYKSEICLDLILGLGRRGAAMAAVRWLRWGGAAVIGLPGRLRGSVLRVRVWCLEVWRAEGQKVLRRRTLWEARGVEHATWLQAWLNEWHKLKNKNFFVLLYFISIKKNKYIKNYLI